MQIRFPLVRKNKNALNEELAFGLKCISLLIGKSKCTVTDVPFKNKSKKRMKAILKIDFGEIPKSVLIIEDRIVLKIFWSSQSTCKDK